MPIAADTDPITKSEMMALFGEYMPMAAVQLLWEAPGSMTVGEVRKELRRIACLKKLGQLKEGKDAGA